MPAQRSFEDLGTPLAEVTFCVVDLETTGAAAATCGITEIGAAKVLRGEMIGTFQTLVNPAVPVPASIRLLTGITDELLVDAPYPEAVLPSFLEFARGSVLVAHNARFDVGFLNAALARAGYDKLPNQVLDTAALARRILAGEVPNNRLATLAQHLRCAHRPTHRAFPDVLATIDLLHHLIERVAGFGVTTLEDLAAMTTARLDGTFAKIRLADGAPRGIGVYRFLGASGETLYVGKAAAARARLRSYFYGDPRRQIRNLLREAQDIRVEPFRTMLEAEVAEGRAIATELPPYNRAGKRMGAWFVKVTLRRNPKVSLARSATADGAVCLGPFTARAARTLLDGVRDAGPIHRCADPAKCGGCAFEELGTCAGGDAARHRDAIRAVANGIAGASSALLDPIGRRMRALAAQARFEEAADQRERGALLERALRKHGEIEALVAAGDLVLLIGEGRAVLVRSGRLEAAADVIAGDEREVVARLLRPTGKPSPGESQATVSQAESRREAALISSWLRRNAGEVRVFYAERAWALPVGAGPSAIFDSPNREAVAD